MTTNFHIPPPLAVLTREITNVTYSSCCFRKKEAGYEEFELPTGQPLRPDLYGAPEGLPEPVRPPLRPIDMYVRAECPCLSQRYTVALLTCLGFIISFGMRCNMGMAKLQLERRVSYYTPYLP